MFVLKKVAIFAALLVTGVAYLGWLPKERADRFVRMTVGFFAIGFAWRVGAWLMSRP